MARCATSLESGAHFQCVLKPFPGVGSGVATYIRMKGSLELVGTYVYVRTAPTESVDGSHLISGPSLAVNIAKRTIDRLQRLGELVAPQ